jgi:hypothetical protein
MTTVRRVDPAQFGIPYDFEAWKAEEFGWRKRVKPRRRTLRAQAEPQQLRGTFVNRRIVLGERAHWWSGTEWPNLGRIVLALACFVLGAFLFFGGIRLP